MRWLILAVLAVPSMFAQSEVARPPAPKPKSWLFAPESSGRHFQPPDAWKKLFQHPQAPSATIVPAPPRKQAVILKPGQQCAIPLLNVLKSKFKDRMVIPPANGDMPMREVIVPAPSCDDVKK